MPCHSDGPISEEERFEMSGALNAVLCGILTRWDEAGTFDDNFKSMDWKEIGVAPEVVKQWWVRHRTRDIERRLREKQAAEKKLANELKEYNRLKKQFEGK